MGTFEQAQRVPEEGNNNLNWLVKRLSTPPDMPIFKEADVSLSQTGMTLGIHSSLMSEGHRFEIMSIVRTPGHSAVENWYLEHQGHHLSLQGPFKP